MIRGVCDGCGLITLVEWYESSDVPEDVEPGGYCLDCAKERGLKLKGYNKNEDVY